MKGHLVRKKQFLQFIRINIAKEVSSLERNGVRNITCSEEPQHMHGTVHSITKLGIAAPLYVPARKPMSRCRSTVTAMTGENRSPQHTV